MKPVIDSVRPLERFLETMRRGSPAPKRPAKPCLSCSRSISFCCFFQSTPKGGLVRK